MVKGNWKANQAKRYRSITLPSSHQEKKFFASMQKVGVKSMVFANTGENQRLGILSHADYTVVRLD